MSKQVVALGKCLDVMRLMPPESVHAVVCDPPYGLEFMDEDWDAPHKGVANANRGMNEGAIVNAPGFDLSVENARALQEWHAEWLAEALRVLKPGGFIVAFSGTRTYHRLACAAEDVGFEVRDMLEWFYGGGFPKSLNVSLAIDKHLGREAEREVVGQKHAERYPNGPGGTSFTVAGEGADGTRTAERTLETLPASVEAAEWDGYGTALKPAHEPILLGRKPVVGTVAANVLRHGVGGLNVRAARIETEDSLNGGATSTGNHEPGKRHDGWERPWQSDENQREAAADRARDNLAEAEALGRWPANLILTHGEDCLLVGTQVVERPFLESGAVDSPGKTTYGSGGPGGGSKRTGVGEQVIGVWDCGPGCPVALLDAQSGDLKAGGSLTGREPSSPFGGAVYGSMTRNDRPWTGFGDRGGASRFFYTSKASRSEREAGCEDLEPGELLWSSGDASPGTFQGEGTVRQVRNYHPTVKPIAVMRWLLRLVVPAGGLALDPFLGSGTTAAAAALEGVDLVGVEQEEAFVSIAAARIAFWREHGEAGFEVASRRHAGAQRRRVVEGAGQLDLFAG